MLAARASFSMGTLSLGALLDHPDNLDFRSRVRADGNWRAGDWRAGVFMTRYGSLPKFSGTARTNVHFLWNAHVGRQMTDRAALRFYVNNLLDNIHPEDETNNDFPYFYDAYHPVGREVALEVDYRF